MSAVYMYYFSGQVNTIEEEGCRGEKGFLYSGTSLSVGDYENGWEDILLS